MKDEAEIQLCQAFGKNLAKIRKGKGWSQESLANESGLARSYIGDVERGLRNISLVNICKIADTLQIEVVELMKARITSLSILKLQSILKLNCIFEIP